MASRTKSASLKPGDRVQWETSQGTTQGRVVRQVTGTQRIGGHVAKATPSSPEVEVESERSGKHAIHRPGSLKKIGGSSAGRKQKIGGSSAGRKR